MPPLDRAAMQAFETAGLQAPNTAAQGKALEDLICYVFGEVPGIAITRRNQMNAFHTEEIDVALWNDNTQGILFFLPNIILVECKNWSTPVSSIEVNWFDSKLRNRGLDFGILVSPHGITGQADELTRAHATIALALRERRRLIVLSTAELLALADTDALAALIKEKLCDLAVKGTVV